MSTTPKPLSQLVWLLEEPNIYSMSSVSFVEVREHRCRHLLTSVVAVEWEWSEVEGGVSVGETLRVVQLLTWTGETKCWQHQTFTISHRSEWGKTAVQVGTSARSFNARRIPSDNRDGGMLMG